MEIGCPYFSSKLFTETNILFFKQFILVSYKMCRMDAFISHSAIDAKSNLNNSKLHLNIRGSRKLQENFAEVFERLF